MSSAPRSPRTGPRRLQEEGSRTARRRPLAAVRPGPPHPRLRDAERQRQRPVERPRRRFGRRPCSSPPCPHRQWCGEGPPSTTPRHGRGRAGRVSPPPLPVQPVDVSLRWIPSRLNPLSRIAVRSARSNGPPRKTWASSPTSSDPTGSSGPGRPPCPGGGCLTRPSPVLNRAPISSTVFQSLDREHRTRIGADGPGAANPSNARLPVPGRSRHVRNRPGAVPACSFSGLRPDSLFGAWVG